MHQGDQLLAGRLAAVAHYPYLTELSLSFGWRLGYLSITQYLRQIKNEFPSKAVCRGEESFPLYFRYGI